MIVTKFHEFEFGAVLLEHSLFIEVARAQPKKSKKYVYNINRFIY